MNLISDYLKVGDLERESTLRMKSYSREGMHIDKLLIQLDVDIKCVYLYFLKS